MKSRPILFSGPLVRALLDGRKTLTRRTRGLERFTSRGDFIGMRKRSDGVWVAEFLDSIPDDPCPIEVRSPYGGPGDTLWVRETWRTSSSSRHYPTKVSHFYAEWFAQTVYRSPSRGRQHQSEWVCSDEQHVALSRLAYGSSRANTWRPSIHMPRWASRITLEVTGVRVERLQSITEEDAKAEGVERLYGRDVASAMGGGVETWRDYGNPDGWVTSATASFMSLWRSINGPDSWASNPWVWVVEFPKVVTP